MRSFASDNNSGAHPLVLEALAEANAGHAVGYGADPWTERAQAAVADLFGPDATAYFVFLGTAANVLGLQALVRPFEAVVCADHAHIHVDECGAPERHLGCKLLPLTSDNGKIRPEQLKPLLASHGFEHHSQPRAVSITQATEFGALYTADEVRALADLAHENGMFLHMDGARLANACAAKGLSLKALCADTGVDVVSLGGTKNGLMFGEAVVFLRPGLDGHFRYQRKQAMQLYSKMRFVSAQFLALFGTDLWLENARRANAMAARLARGLERYEDVTVTRPVQTNAVFARLPRQAAHALREDFFFYVWDQVSQPESPEVRWMCSFDTTDEDVDAFLTALDKAMGKTLDRTEEGA